MCMFFILVIDESDKGLFYCWIGLLFIGGLCFEIVWCIVGDKFFVINQFDVIVIFCFIYKVGCYYYCDFFFYYVINVQLKFMMGEGINFGCWFIKE